MKFNIHIDKERCKGCELCLSVCPENVLAMSMLLNAKGQHYTQVDKPENCIGCAQCSLICPDAAIEIESEDN